MTITVQPTTLGELLGSPELSSKDDDDVRFIISGTLGKKLDQKAWREPPHVAFANLRTDDPKSLESFVGRYGVLFHYDRRVIEDPLGYRGSRTDFSTNSSDLDISQDRLREAWHGSSSAIVDIEGYVEENMMVSVLVTYGSVHLLTKDLWTMICFLFLRDFTAGKLGVCENPDCPAPFFRKKRNTQKFCEAGPCVAFAQRQYALKWWNAKGKKRREGKHAKRQNRKRKMTKRTDRR